MAFEIDHLFVAGPAGCAALDRLLARGFAEGRPNSHPGQGTACRRIFFDESYLEFLWLENRAEAASDAVRPTGLLQRADVESGASHFGICLRSTEAAGEELPFAVREYTPPYLPEGLSISIGRNADRLDEPLLFFLSPGIGRRQNVIDHPNGAQSISNVSLLLAPGESTSPELHAFGALGLVEVARGAGPVMHLELDGATRGESIDLRPEIDLVVDW